MQSACNQTGRRAVTAGAVEDKEVGWSAGASRRMICPIPKLIVRGRVSVVWQPTARAWSWRSRRVRFLKLVEAR